MGKARTRVAQRDQDMEVLRASLPPGPESTARPVMVILSGLPGSGKSYFGRRLVEQVPLLTLQSDGLRKILFPNPSYAEEESARLFDACHALIEDLLARGTPLLIDATNLVESHRERLYRAARQPGVLTVLVYLTAPREVAYRRLQRRSQGTAPEDNSDAGREVYDRMRSAVEPIRRGHLVVDTSKDIAPAVAEVAGKARLWMQGTAGANPSAVG